MIGDQKYMDVDAYFFGKSVFSSITIQSVTTFYCLFPNIGFMYLIRLIRGNIYTMKNDGC